MLVSSNESKKKMKDAIFKFSVRLFRFQFLRNGNEKKRMENMIFHLKFFLSKWIEKLNDINFFIFFNS